MEQPPWKRVGGAETAGTLVEGLNTCFHATAASLVSSGGPVGVILGTDEDEEDEQAAFADIVL